MKGLKRSRVWLLAGAAGLAVGVVVVTVGALLLGGSGLMRTKAPLKSPFVELLLDGGHYFGPGDSLTFALRFAVPAGQKLKFVPFLSRTPHR